MTLDAYQILVGAGTLYIAPASEAAPEVDAVPAGNWSLVGETDGGVTVTFSETMDMHRTDQRTGPVKATRSEETAMIETNVAQFNMEALADILGNTVTDTAAGSGTIGKKDLGVYRGLDVDEYAFLFRADSPYGDYPAQYYVPRGVLKGEVGMEFVKDGKTLIPYQFEALEDFSASDITERFGLWTAQDADALP